MNQIEVIGQCPICDRDMWKGPSIDKHHMTPKCKGGKKTEFVHRICHTKIHSIWTESELEKEFNNAEAIRENEEMKKFIKWVQKKEPDFYDRNEQHKRKRR
jgi:hypothetical protein